MQKTESQSKKTGAGFKDIAKQIAGYTTAAGLAVDVGKKIVSTMANLAKEGVSTAAAWEKSRTTWGVLVGDMEYGNDIFESLLNFAAKTPLSFDAINSAATTLKGFGIEADDLIPTMQKLGDVSQGNNEALSQLALVFGQVKAQGKAMTQDLYQFVNAGIPIFQLLADSMGISAGEVKELAAQSKISFDEINSAITKATDAGGQFYGMMDKTAQSTAGKWSTAQDNFKQKLAELGEKVLPVVNAALDAFNNSFKVETLEDKTDRLSELNTRIADMRTALAGKLDSRTRVYLEAGLKAAVDTSNALGQQIAAEQVLAQIEAERTKEAEKKESADDGSAQRNKQALKLYESALKAVRDLEREEQARQDIMGDLVDYQALSNAAYDEARKLITESNGLITEANPLYKELVQLALDYKEAARATTVEVEDTADSVDEIATSTDDATVSAKKLAVAWDDIKNAASAVWDAAGDTAGAFFDLVQNGYDAEIAAMEAAGATDEEIQAKKNEQAQKMFNANKATSIADALINGAVAVTKALELGVPAGPIAAAAIAGLTGTQVAAIAAQQYVPFAQGGIVNGPTHALIGEAGPEAIIPLRDMVSGGSSKTINVYQNVAGSIWNTRQLQGLAVGAVKSASRGY